MNFLRSRHDSFFISLLFGVAEYCGALKEFKSVSGMVEAYESVGRNTIFWVPQELWEMHKVFIFLFNVNGLY